MGGDRRRPVLNLFGQVGHLGQWAWCLRAQLQGGRWSARALVHRPHLPLLAQVSAESQDLVFEDDGLGDEDEPWNISRPPAAASTEGMMVIHCSVKTRGHAHIISMRERGVNISSACGHGA